MSLENYTTLMNADIDSLEYSPDYLDNLPSGAYLGTVMKCEFDTKENSKQEEKVIVSLVIRIDNVLEDNISPDGLVGNAINYTMWDEGGITNGFVKPLRETLREAGCATVQDMVTHLASGVQISFVNAQKANKKDDGTVRYFHNLKAATLA